MDSSGVESVAVKISHPPLVAVRAFGHQVTQAAAFTALPQVATTASADIRYHSIAEKLMTIITTALQ